MSDDFRDIYGLDRVYFTAEGIGLYPVRFIHDFVLGVYPFGSAVVVKDYGR